MKKTLFFHSVIMTIALFMSSCSKVGITGRNQFIVVPDSFLTSMSLKQYDEFLKQNKVSTNRAQTKKVKQVGENIVNAVKAYCKDRNIQSELQNYEWEFNLIDSNEVNAWAMPGGKVAVYTGLLPVAQTEAGLAVVIGHEIAHVFAKHGAERMSQNMLVQVGSFAVSKALEEKPEATKKLFMASYGMGSQVAFTLPYSRKHEKEADRLGLIFMAMGGYEPSVAIDFWQRMADSSDGKKRPPEFLSTHPVSDTRIRLIRQNMSEAVDYYERFGKK